MALRSSQLSGFGIVVEGLPIIELQVSADTLNFNVFDMALAAGGSFGPDDDVEGGEVRITIQNNLFIGSADPLLPAMLTGTGWGMGWLVRILALGTSVATVEGAGGVGGLGAVTDVGFKTFTRFRLPGGGGGAGSLPGSGAASMGSNGTRTAGGAGSSTSTESPGTPIDLTPENGGNGGIALFVNDAGPDVYLSPSALATLRLWGGGGGTKGAG